METSRRSTPYLQARNRPSMDLARANAILESLYGHLNSQNLPVFGRSMLCDDDPSRIILTTVANRILKKFQKPVPGGRTALREKCYAQWVAHEELISKFSWDNVPLKHKSYLFRARELLHSWFTDFKLAKDVLEFTPGETFTSLRGNVSVYQKLLHRDAWTVTHDASDDFIRLVYNTLSLKRAAKAHMLKLSRDELNGLYNMYAGASHVGFAVFKHRMLNEVVTLVHGSRASSVYKNNDEERFIEISPLGNMLLQRQAAHPVRDTLKRVGNDLDTGQDVHRIRIRDTSVSTVDFSKASDSVLLKVVNLMFPRSITQYLNRYRSYMVLLGDDYYVPAKLSSMGNGFTFEIMSALLLAIARVLDPNATVYGDDVIIETSVADLFCEITGSICFKVNEKKTFIGSPFRESCGAFFLDGYGYITCFDLKWLECDNDILIAANKLYLIAEGLGNLDPYYGLAYQEILRLVPALSRAHGPLSNACPDVGYAYDKRARRKCMQDEAARSFFRSHEQALSLVSSLYCVPLTDLQLVMVPQFVNDMASPTYPNVRDPFRLAHYYYGGRRSKDTVRNKGVWVYKLYVVGRSFRVSLKEAKALLAFEACRLDRWLADRSIFQSYSGLGRV